MFPSYLGTELKGTRRMAIDGHLGGKSPGVSPPTPSATAPGEHTSKGRIADNTPAIRGEKLYPAWVARLLA